MASDPKPDKLPRQDTQFPNLAAVVGLAAVFTLIPPFLPVFNNGGGGGGGPGSGGGGGGDGAAGGSDNPLIPSARADNLDDDDDDDDEEGAEEEDDDDEDEDMAKSRSMKKEGAGKGEEDDDEGKEDDEEEEEDDEDDDIDEDEEEMPYLEPPPGVDRSAFYCVAVEAVGLPKGPPEIVPTDDEIFAPLNCQPGFWVPRRKLKEDLKILKGMGLFRGVDVKIVPLKKYSASRRMKAVFTFTEIYYPPVKSFKVVNSKVLPPDLGERVMKAIKKNYAGQPTGMLVLGTIRKEIETWYTDRGFNYCQIKEFDGVDTGDIQVKVVEPRIRRVSIKFVDENMQEKATGGQTPEELIRRVITLRPGQYYSNHDGRLALQQAFTLQAFENAQIMPEMVPNQPDQMDITVMLRERAMQTMDVEMDWALSSWLPRVPVPLPASVMPGGTLTYEDRNFQKRGDHVHASVMCSNFLHPTDDLSLRGQFRRPYVFGRERNEDLVLDVFNTRRLSAALVQSGEGHDSPAVWVERAGLKAALVQNLTRHSHSSLGVVAQQIKTRDDTNQLVAAAQKTNAQGELIGNGPATTLSGTGCDKTVELQFSLTRDTTFLINGAIIGSRDLASVQQGIGIGNGFFNRYMVSLTRFLKLNTPSMTSPLPPASLVLHAKHGSTCGPLASYDYHVLGGIHSCRGYSLGELGPARTFLETAAELRLPVPILNTHAYGFVEQAADLGGAADLTDKPREFYNQLGFGRSYGVGIKLGPLRTELCRDCNHGRFCWFVNFGERF